MTEPTRNATPQREHDWHLSAEYINRFQNASIERLVLLCKHAHYTNVKVRINGEWQEFEADWIKHMVPSSAESETACTLTVHFTEMVETNGRVTYGVFLGKPGAKPWECHQVYSDTIKGRAEYEAARLRHFLGQGPEPDILAFDTDAPKTTALSAGASSTPRTDAIRKSNFGVALETCEQLERELAEARAALSVAADAGQVAMMLLQNDCDGAMQWARDIELEWKTDGSPRLKLRATAMPSATAAISFSDIEQIINARIARLEAHTDPAGNVTGPDFNVCEIEQLRGVLAEVKEKLRRSDSGKADK